MARACPWPGHKQARPRMDPLRFRKVRHKNLVRLLGVILHNGLYIVMEFMSKVRAPGRSPASRTHRRSDLGIKTLSGD